MGEKSNCSVICTLFKITFLGKWDEWGARPFLWPLTILSSTVSSCFEQFCWDLTNLWSDRWHEQPLNEVLEALAPNILVQFLSLPHHGTSLYNTLFICLQFVQLQSNLCQLLTGYTEKVGETFQSLIWLSGRTAGNFVLSSLLLIPRMCLLAAAVHSLCTSAFSSWYRFSSLPFASLFSLTAAKVSPDIHFFFLLRLHGSNRFSGHFQQDCIGTYPEIWGDLILCSIQCRKPVGHLCCKLYCFLFHEFHEIQRRNAVLSFVF